MRAQVSRGAQTERTVRATTKEEVAFMFGLQQTTRQQHQIEKNHKDQGKKNQILFSHEKGTG